MNDLQEYPHSLAHGQYGRRSFTREVRSVSIQEYLFVDPMGLDVWAAANGIAGTLDFRLTSTPYGIVISTHRLSDALPYELLGDFDRNIFAAVDPEDSDGPAVYDDFPLVWTVRALDPPGIVDELTQRRAVRTVTERLTETLPRWRFALTHDIELLDATYDAGRGLRIFPEGTPSDSHGEHLWR